MIDFTDYIWFFTLFDFSTSWWEVKMIYFIEYIAFFFTFRLFNILVGGINDHFYWIYSNFSTFRPLAGRSNWSTLLDTLDYFWLFDFLTCFWEVKMIDFIEYIEFFRLLLILMNILFFFRLFDFLISWCLVKMIDLTEYILFFRLFDFSTSWWGEGKNDQFHWLYFDFFRLFDLRPLAGS